MKTYFRLHRLSPLTRFILLGSLLELLYVLLCPLFPSNISFPIASPFNTDWLLIITSMQSFSAKISDSGPRYNATGSSLILLTLLLIALAGIYLLTVAYAFQTGNNRHLSTRWLILPLFGACTFGVTLLVFPTFFNQNIQNNTWKILSLFFHLINCVLIWIILFRMAPHRRLEGTILYAWNPLILIEMVGNGQSYGLSTFFLLLTAVFVIQNKSKWHELLAMIFLGCASAIHLLSFLLAPMLIYFCVRRETNQLTSTLSQPENEQRGTLIPPIQDNWRKHYPRILGECVWRTAVVLMTAFILYLSIWQGRSSFTSINSFFDMRYLMHSPLSIMALPVQWLNSHIFHILYPSNTPASNYLQAIPAANMAVQASGFYLFFLFYIYLFGKVRSLDSLFASLCLVILGFLILLSVQFWPWYIIWMLGIVALRRFDALTVSVVLLSCTALLSYPLFFVKNVPITTYLPLLIFGIPLIYLITQLARSNERMILFNDRRSETAKN